MLDEPGETVRIFAPGDDFRDADGDGRLSAWSGRLREGIARNCSRFALRVESSDGRIPLNAGWLTIGDGIEYFDAIAKSAQTKTNTATGNAAPGNQSNSE